MRPTIVVAALVAAACAVPAERRPDPKAPGSEAVFLPHDDDTDRPPRPDDPQARKRHLAERFPGVRDVGLVKVLAWPEPSQGMCWSELTPVHRSGVSLEYSTGWLGRRRSIGTFAGLLEDGWIQVYRAPQGEGFERRDDFREIDLVWETDLRCLCAPEAKILSGDSQRLQLRLRWTKGRTPEVGATASRNGTTEGLIGSVTAGRLPVYEFAASGRFPNGQTGNCGAHLWLALLIEPPIL
jgi:hypothetical protein